MKKEKKDFVPLEVLSFPQPLALRSGYDLKIDVFRKTGKTTLTNQAT